MALMARRSLFFAIFALSAQLATHRVCAQDTHFDQGVSALEAGNNESAEEQFRLAYEADPTDLIQLNWADALLRLGRAREAADLLQPLAIGSSDLLIRDAAQQLEAEARQQLGSIRVQVPGEQDAISVRMDGREVEGGRVSVDAGPRRVEVRRDDELIYDETVTVGAGEALDLRVPSDEDDASGAVPGAAFEPDSPDVRRRKRRRRLGFGIAGAIVAAGLVGLIVASTRSDGRADGNVEPIDLWGAR